MINSQEQLTKIAKRAIDKGYNNVEFASSENGCYFKASNNSSKDTIPKKPDYFKYFLIILEAIKKVVSVFNFFQ
jgi:hypothetical protein